MKTQRSTPNLTIFESALYRTTSTVIVTDEYVLVVDPNWLPDEVKTIRAFCAKHERGREKFLLFTHSDYDHIIGYGAFVGYTTIASQRFVDNPDAEKQLAQTVAWDDEYYIRRDYALTYPTIDRPVSGDGTEMVIGKDTYVFYQAPGHNYDGLITFNKSRRILIVGDYLSDIEFPYVYHSFQDYQGTLNKIEALLHPRKPMITIPGHGDYATDAIQAKIRLREDLSYLISVRLAILEGREFPLAEAVENLPFPGIMRAFHEKNMALARKEFGKS